MKSGVILPWLVAEAIFSYRVVHTLRRPPIPGELLGMSGLFLALALLEGPAPQLAALIGWGVDIAALLQMFGKPGASTLANAISGPGAPAGPNAPSAAPRAPATTSPSTGPNARPA